MIAPIKPLGIPRTIAIVRSMRKPCRKDGTPPGFRRAFDEYLEARECDTVSARVEESRIVEDELRRVGIDPSAGSLDMD